MRTNGRIYAGLVNRSERHLPTFLARVLAFAVLVAVLVFVSVHSSEYKATCRQRRDSTGSSLGHCVDYVCGWGKKEGMEEV